jgi:hypothetical protein
MKRLETQEQGTQGRRPSVSGESKFYGGHGFHLPNAAGKTRLSRELGRAPFRRFKCLAARRPRSRTRVS